MPHYHHLPPFDPGSCVGWDHNVYGEWDDASLDEWTWDLDEALQIADRFERETGHRPKIMRYPMYEMPDGSITTDCVNHNGEEV